jgi:peptidoglycan hydrolase-like protein with peptidoglycan-binding domain
MKIVISEEQLKTLVHLIKEDNGKINVMFVGDSHSAGDGWTWNYLIAKDHPEWDVTQVAKGGMRTDWMLENLTTKLNEKKYDLVFIYGGANDVMSPQSISVPINNIQKMVDLVNGQGGKAIVLVGFDSETIFNPEKVKTTKYCDRECMISYKPKRVEYQAKLASSITGAVVIPKLVGDMSWSNDGIHVGSAQHKLMRDQVYSNMGDLKNVTVNTNTNSGANTETQTASQRLFKSIQTILSKKDNMESGATPEDIKTMQFSLNVINKSDLPMTGQIDGETTQAIEDYQETNNLEQTGKLTPDTTGGIISDLLFKITGKRYTFGKSSTTEKSEQNFNPMVIENPGIAVRTFPSDIESKFKNAVGDNYDSFISDVQAIGLDPKIAIRQLFTESAFNPDVMSCKRNSSAGAKGIAQFMPGTWPTYGGGGDPCNISDALKAYPKMMKVLLDKFPGRLDLVIAGYNSGPNLQVPKNSKNYVYNNALKNKTPFTELKGVIPNETYKYASSILQP